MSTKYSNKLNLSLSNLYKPEIYLPNLEKLVEYTKEEKTGKRSYFFPDDDDTYYSVSTICKELLPFYYRNKIFSDTEAMDRGTRIHKFMECCVKNEDPPLLSMEDGIHCKNLYHYANKNFQEIYLSEAVVRSKSSSIIKYAGMIDLLCLCNGEITLVDYKIANANTAFQKNILPVYLAQLCGYSKALIENGINITRVMLLRSMPQEGSVQVVSKPLEEVEPYFTKAVQRFKHNQIFEGSFTLDKL